jgi:NADP-dependent 3-hydroxy acid dehydrogenase YdfG
MTNNENVLAIASEVSKINNVKNIVNRTLKKYGIIDYLINFAGYDLGYGKNSIIRPNSEAAKILEKIINVDLLGTFRMISYVEPIMRRQNYGLIITVATTTYHNISSKPIKINNLERYKN